MPGVRHTVVLDLVSAEARILESVAEKLTNVQIISPSHSVEKFYCSIPKVQI